MHFKYITLVCFHLDTKEALFMGTEPFMPHTLCKNKSTSLTSSRMIRKRNLNVASQTKKLPCHLPILPYVNFLLGIHNLPKIIFQLEHRSRSFKSLAENLITIPKVKSIQCPNDKFIGSLKNEQRFFCVCVYVYHHHQALWQVPPDEMLITDC